MSEGEAPGGGVGRGRPPRHLLISGAPGCGKTTLLVRLARQFADLYPAGFYTAEIRVAGARQGFRLLGLDGSQGVLAHRRLAAGERVGRYGVDVAAFEAFLERLRLEESAAPLILVDEVGKMECLSPRFIGMLRHLLDSGKTVVATVAQSGSGFIAEVKARDDVELLLLTRENRERLLPILVERLWSVLGGRF